MNDSLESILALVTAALAPTEAILRAEYARQLSTQCDQVLAELKADGWDADKRYGYPATTLGRQAYHAQKRKYDLCRQYTLSIKSSWSFKESDIREPKPDNAERVAEMAAECAKQALGSFCAKLVGKIVAVLGNTPVATVTYQGGRDPWGWSHVVVNQKQIWRTRMIVNFSIKGKPFNQWPTRLVQP